MRSPFQRFAPTFCGSSRGRTIRDSERRAAAGVPAIVQTIPWHAARPMSRNSSSVHAMQCGASRTLSRSAKRFGSVTGSFAKQSSRRAAMRRRLQCGVQRIFVDDAAARGVDEIRIPASIRDSSRSPMRFRVCSVSGTVIETKSNWIGAARPERRGARRASRPRLAQAWDQTPAAGFMPPIGQKANQSRAIPPRPITRACGHAALCP